MGKVFHNHKLISIIRRGREALALIAALLLWVSETRASYQEFELFDKGYEYYLSYQPEKAVEIFTVFLKEFPESSAKDAALFWLGKSLIHVKSFDEARKAFSRLQDEFPESHFIPHLKRELETLGEAAIKKTGTGGEPAKSRDAREPEKAVDETKIYLIERETAKAVEERDKLRLLFEEEKKKAGDMRARIAELEKGAAESRILLAKQEEERKKMADEMERALKELRDQKERPEAERQSVRKEDPLKDDDKRGNEKKDVKDVPRGYEASGVRIKEKRYTTLQVIDFVVNASSATVKSGIREVPWRSGNIYEDFINEHILFDEAKRVNVVADAGKVNELAGKFKLTRDEAEYLSRYLVISNLIDRKIKSIPEERVVESLTVHYTDSDKQVKVTLATELQGQAREGKAFEEIAAAFPDKVRFSVIGFQELQGWIKERIELLKDGEVSVVWTRDGYMILKPVMKRASYRPFEAVSPGTKNEIRAFVSAWIEALKKEIKEIEIISAQ